MSLAKAFINITNLQKNLAVIKNLAPNSFIAAVVKANAYGHGYEEIVKGLQHCVHGFCVSSMNEALVVRQFEPHLPILVLQGFSNQADLEAIERYNLQTVLHSSKQLELLKTYQWRSRHQVWLKINTGMNRLGIALEDYKLFMDFLCERPDIDLGIMSHFSQVNLQDIDFTNHQTQVLDDLMKESNHRFPVSLANSAGILIDDTYHRDHVRPGIMMYGVSPFVHQSAQDIELKPVMNFESEIIALQHCSKGQLVGYGMSYPCPKDMLIGIASVGYGDGYPQKPPPNTPVIVGGRKVVIIGEVSMDMLAIDLSNYQQCQIGDQVILWGEGLPVETVAKHMEMSGYALVAGITERVERISLS